MLAKWALIENNSISGLYDLLPKNWRNVSNLDKAKDDIDFLRSIGWYPVIKQYQSYNSDTHYVRNYDYLIDNMSVIESLILEEKPPQPQPPSIEEIKTLLVQAIREKRNELLKETDWTQLQDVNLTEDYRSAWLVYRQQLRDITEVARNNDWVSIDNVIWPEKPNIEHSNATT